jgi:hypothetical protein
MRIYIGTTWLIVNAFIIAALSGCGKPHDSDSSGEAIQKSVETPQDTSESNFATLLQSVTDLPECNTARQSDLVYIKDAAAFYTCDKNNWSKVNINGKDGANGANGKDGVSTANIWDDPVTGKRWLIGGLEQYPDGTGSNRLNNCTGDYRLPDKIESLAAAQRGIGNVASSISAPMSIWTTDIIDASNAYYMDLSGIPVARSGSKATSYGAYCVHK